VSPVTTQPQDQEDKTIWDAFKNLSTTATATRLSKNTTGHYQQYKLTMDKRDNQTQPGGNLSRTHTTTQQSADTNLGQIKRVRIKQTGWARLHTQSKLRLLICKHGKQSESKQTTINLDNLQQMVSVHKHCFLELWLHKLTKLIWRRDLHK